MTTPKATVKGGRLELNVPADWPDGTEVEIHPIDQASRGAKDSMATSAIPPNPGTTCQEEEPLEDGWSNSPEAIADWLKWYDSLQPLLLTAAEEADAEAWMRKANEYAIAKMEKSSQDIFQ